MLLPPFLSSGGRRALPLSVGCSATQGWKRGVCNYDSNYESNTSNSDKKNNKRGNKKNQPKSPPNQAKLNHKKQRSQNNKKGNSVYLPLPSQSGVFNGITVEILCSGCAHCLRVTSAMLRGPLEGQAGLSNFHVN